VPPIVTLTTDFGTQDAFVAAMKGVLLARCPSVQLVDITHEIPPHSVRTGALRLAAAAPYFPPDTVHLVVVDPGVGSERRAVAVEARGHRFVGPDNGVLSLAAARAARRWKAAELTNPVYRLAPVSNTFHGRDIFAPAAAHLACGGSLEELGNPVDSMVELVLAKPARVGDVLHGVVLDIDRFGNLITNIYADDLADREVDWVKIGSLRIEGLSTWYDETRSAVAVVDSAGRVEIALPGRSAAHQLDVGLDEPVEIRLRSSA
jgi:S-adenosyl-L-methionine hydrolase (adenosine-forming)